MPCVRIRARPGRGKRVRRGACLLLPSAAFSSSVRPVPPGRAPAAGRRPPLSVLPYDAPHEECSGRRRMSPWGRRTAPAALKAPAGTPIAGLEHDQTPAQIPRHHRPRAVRGRVGGCRRAARPRRRATATSPSRTGRAPSSRRSPSVAPTATRSSTTTATLFKPEQAITRELLARSLVLASGPLRRERRRPSAITDVADDSPLLQRHPGGAASRLHDPGRRRCLQAAGSGAGLPGGGRDHPLAQGAVFVVQLDPAHEPQAVTLAAQRRLEDRRARAIFPTSWHRGSCNSATTIPRTHDGHEVTPRPGHRPRRSGLHVLRAPTR